MLKIALAFVAFFMLLTLILWAILDKLFVSNLAIIIVCEIFLIGVWWYGAFEIVSYERRKLRELLAKKDKKLKKQADKIAFKNTQLSTLLSGISHELKNPLFIIKMSVAALYDSSNLQNQSLVQKIDKNADRMQKILSNLRLLFSSKNIILNSSEVSLAKLSTQVALNLSQKYKSRIKISGERLVNADFDLLELALFNLCENALKYSQKEVRVYINWRGIFVRDFGNGMSERQLKLAQKRLFKSNEYDWNNSLGLGLFLVRKICNAHKFKLKAISVPKKGTLMGILMIDY